MTYRYAKKPMRVRHKITGETGLAVAYRPPSRIEGYGDTASAIVEWDSPGTLLNTRSYLFNLVFRVPAVTREYKP